MLTSLLVEWFIKMKLLQPYINYEMQECFNFRLCLLFSQFAPNTKWKGKKLPTNDLYCVCIESDTVKLSSFQDEVDMNFEDECNGDAPELSIHTIRKVCCTPFWSFFFLR